MSNEYDVNIKMNYFMSGTSYEESLEDLKKFTDEVEGHLAYWQDTCIDEESFNEEWNQMVSEIMPHMESSSVGDALWMEISKTD